MAPRAQEGSSYPVYELSPTRHPPQGSRAPLAPKEFWSVGHSVGWVESLTALGVPTSG